MVFTRNAGRAPTTQNSQRRNPTRRARPSLSDLDEASSDEAMPSHTRTRNNVAGPTHSDSDSSSGSDSASDRSQLWQPRSRTCDAAVSSKRRHLPRNTKSASSRNTNTEFLPAKPTPIKQIRRVTGVNKGRGRAPLYRPLLTPTKKHDRVQVGHDPELTGKIPDWRDPRIPYGCWVDIMLYAASEGIVDDLANSWLINAATTCQNFTEPALTAIYRCPVIRTQAKAKRLVALLERSPSETRLNYRIKIESLNVDIHIVPQSVLYQLIHPLTRLKELVVFTPLDQPPYRKLDANVRWHYPEDIFRALSPASPAVSAQEKPFPAILKSWEWSGRLIGGYVSTIGDITRIHQMPSFSQLTRLSFTNFQVPSLHNLKIKSDDDADDLQSYQGDSAVIENIGHAISQLNCLKHLIFESSTVMCDQLLPFLPKNLLHLELINCWEIKSEDITPFLHTHGTNLRTLTLLHNQSLNLAFLTDLADSCPNLRELQMNLSYFRHHDCFNDADPMYANALLPHEVPKWPSSLRLLEIEHIRYWPVEAAEMFLQSLVDSSGNLPNLRYLAIKTMLDIPWQDRAALRSKWRSELERVFLRPFQPPIMSSPTPKPDIVEVNTQPHKRKRDTSPSTPSPPSRRSGRIATNVDANLRCQGDTKTSQHSGKPMYQEAETDEDEFDVPESSEMEDAESSGELQSSGEEIKPMVQGLCKTVNILFDNQKVREIQYGMEDFLADDNGDDSEEESNWR